MNHSSKTIQLTCERVFQSRNLTLPSDAFLQPNIQEEQKEKATPEKQQQQQQEVQEEKKPEKKEETPKEAQQQQRLGCRGPPQMNLLATVFRLRRELHKAEEQRAKVRSSAGVCLLQTCRRR